MSYTIQTRVVTTVDVKFSSFMIGSSFSERIGPLVKRCILTAHGHDTTVSLTLYEDSDTRNLLWLIDQYAREAVMAKN